jgi:hypothetical protein
MDRSWLTFDTLDNGASRVVSLAGLREGETRKQAGRLATLGVAGSA